eukprot:2074004-Amphidinium_carterae.1
MERHSTRLQCLLNDLLSFASNTTASSRTVKVAPIHVNLAPRVALEKAKGHLSTLSARMRHANPCPDPFLCLSATRPDRPHIVEGDLYRDCTYLAEDELTRPLPCPTPAGCYALPVA